VFAIAYLDNILVYSNKTLDKYKKYVRKVLKKAKRILAISKTRKMQIVYYKNRLFRLYSLY
jgi:hypothetical protein